MILLDEKHKHSIEVLDPTFIVQRGNAKYLLSI